MIFFNYFSFIILLTNFKFFIAIKFRFCYIKTYYKQIQRHIYSRNYDEYLNKSPDEILEDIESQVPVEEYLESQRYTGEPKPKSYFAKSDPFYVDYEKVYSKLNLPLSTFIKNNIEELKKDVDITRIPPSKIVDYTEQLDISEDFKHKDYSDILYSLLDAPEIPPKIGDIKANNLYKKCGDMMAEQNIKGHRYPFGGDVSDMYSDPSVYKSWGKTNIEALSPIIKTRSTEGHGYLIPPDKTLADLLCSNQYYVDQKTIKDKVNELRSNKYDTTLDTISLDNSKFEDYSKQFDELIDKANFLASDSHNIDSSLKWLNIYNPWDELIHLQKKSTLLKSKPSGYSEHFINEYKAAFINNEDINNFSYAIKCSMFIGDIFQYYGERDDIKQEKNPFKSEPIPWDPDETPADRLFAMIYPPHGNRPKEKFSVRFPRTSAELDADLKQDKEECLPWVINSSFYKDKILSEYYRKPEEEEEEEPLGEFEEIQMEKNDEIIQKFSDSVAKVPDYNPNFQAYTQSLLVAVDALEALKKCVGFSYAGDIFREQTFSTILNIIARGLSLEYTRLVNNISLDEIKEKAGTDLLPFDHSLFIRLAKTLNEWNVRGAELLYELASLILLKVSHTYPISYISKIAVFVYNGLKLSLKVQRRWLSMLLDVIETRLSEYVINKVSDVEQENKPNYLYENFKEFLPLLEIANQLNIPQLGFVKKLHALFSNEIYRFYKQIEFIRAPQYLSLSYYLIQFTDEYNELITHFLNLVDFNKLNINNFLNALKLIISTNQFKLFEPKIKSYFVYKKYDLVPSQILYIIDLLKENKNQIEIDGLFIYTLLSNFKNAFKPTYDQLFQAFDALIFYKDKMTKEQIKDVVQDIVRDASDYTLITHTGLNAEYVGYPFFVIAKLLKQSSICGYVDMQAWQYFYELIEMHKHTLTIEDILETLKAIKESNFSNIGRILTLLMSRASDVIECTRSIDKLDSILSIMDLSKKLGMFPRELLRWVTYSILYDGREVTNSVSRVLNDPEPKEEHYCFRGMRSEPPNKKLLMAPQHPFNQYAYMPIDINIDETVYYKKFDYSLLNDPSISKAVNSEQLSRVILYIKELANAVIPLKIERRLFLTLLELLNQTETVLYSNLLHRAHPSKIEANSQ